MAADGILGTEVPELEVLEALGIKNIKMLLEKTASTLELDQLLQQIKEIREYALKCEAAFEKEIRDIHPFYQASAKNLLHYLVLRTFNLATIQEQLSTLGLSSIGHSERYTLVNLNNILQLLELLNSSKSIQEEKGFTMNYPKSKKRLEIHAKELFGERPLGSRTRIMVTMPSEAAHDRKLIGKLLDAGMNCARINCSHDTCEDWTKMIKHIKKLSKKKGISCLIYMDLAGPKLRTGTIKDNEIKAKQKKGKKKKIGILLKEGDFLHIYQEVIEGKAVKLNKKGKIKRPARISTTLPDIFNDIKEGESIWFDDGKIGGEIIAIHPDYFEVKITQAGEKGSLLQAAKGINLPDTDLTLPSLTTEDKTNLPFLVDQADIIGYSFVRKPEDVALLQTKLKELGKEDIGIVLKIETWDAFQNLPAILLQAMKSPKIGVMIARGDLAIEVGWERISEIQEEILWICEAAHIPTIWATQVLENLAKKGLATRSEITDAAMSARAECAMLNKGPYIVKAVKALGKITSRMMAHQRKKMGTLRPLGVAQEFLGG